MFINILELVYPIGSFYLSNNDISPAESIGGTWTQIEDAVLRGATSTGYTGADTHNITSNEMPAHNHSASSSSAGAHTHQVGGDDDTQYAYAGNTSMHRNGTSGAGRLINTSSTGAHSHTITIGNTGGGRLCRSFNALTIALFGIVQRRYLQEDVI